MSCWPYLRPGKRYFVTSLGSPKKGDFVVFSDKNKDRFLVKKVVGKEKKGYLVASTLTEAKKGDNFGLISKDRIEGKLIVL